MTKYERIIWRVDKILDNALRAWQYPDRGKRAEQHAEKLKGEINALERLAKAQKRQK